MSNKDLENVINELDKINARERKTVNFKTRLTPSQKVKLTKVCDALDVTSTALVGVMIGMIYGYLLKSGKIKE